jgi:hypothetical protein
LMTKEQTMSNSLATRAGSAARSACSPCCTHGRNGLSSTPRSLPGYRRRVVRRRRHLAPRRETFLFPTSALAALARARFRNAFARVYQDVDLPRHVWQIAWVSRSHHAAGPGPAGRARLSRPLRLSNRHYQQPHSGRRQRDRNLPLQGPGSRPPSQRNRVRP